MSWFGLGSYGRRYIDDDDDDDYDDDGDADGRARLDTFLFGLFERGR